MAGLISRGSSGVNVLMGVEFLRGRTIGYWRAAGESVVKGAAQRVDVAPHIRAARVQCLLRGDVVERPEGHARVRHAAVNGVEVAGEAHVHDLGPAVGSDDDVRRLDVAVDDAALGSVAQSGGNLDHVANALGRRDRTAPVDQLPEVLALDELEGDEVEPLILAAEVDAGDVLVVEQSPRRGPPA